MGLDNHPRTRSTRTLIAGPNAGLSFTKMANGWVSIDRAPTDPEGYPIRVALLPLKVVEGLTAAQITTLVGDIRKANAVLQVHAETLAQLHPEAKVTWGYIGNIEPMWDDRSFRFFTGPTKTSAPHGDSSGGWALWELPQVTDHWDTIYPAVMRKVLQAKDHARGTGNGGAL